MSSPDWETLKEKLVLEIQRSLDYYESQMGHRQITEMVIAPREADTQRIAETLAEEMAVKVTAMDLSANLATNLASNVEFNSSLQQSCMCAIGTALRLK